MGFESNTIRFASFFQKRSKLASIRWSSRKGLKPDHYSYFCSHLVVDESKSVRVAHRASYSDWAEPEAKRAR